MIYRCRETNQRLAVAYHQCVALYITNTQCCISSSRRKDARWRVMPYACGDYIHDCVVITYQSFGLDKKRTKRLLRSFFGWGTGIRTPEMSESESDALPLGDAPLFSTDDIIADNFGFVKTFLEKN